MSRAVPLVLILHLLTTPSSPDLPPPDQVAAIFNPPKSAWLSRSVDLAKAHQQKAHEIWQYLQHQSEYRECVLSIIHSQVAAYRDAGGKGVFGVYVKELNTGSAVGYNHLLTETGGSCGEDPGFFETASTVKLFMAGAIAHLASTGEMSLEDVINDPVLNSGFQIGDIAQRMVSHSVNDYFNVLLRHVGVERFNEVVRLLGARNTRVYCELLPTTGNDGSRNYEVYGSGKAPRTTPRDLALILELAYTGAFGEEHSSFLMDALLKCVYTSRVPRGIDFRAPVAHKTGTNSITWNDAAIVMLDGNPFILVITTYQVNRNPEPWMRAMAKAIFEFHKVRATAENEVGLGPEIP